jgi:hypothetical protein
MLLGFVSLEGQERVKLVLATYKLSLNVIGCSLKYILRETVKTKQCSNSKHSKALHSQTPHGKSQ